MEKEIEPMTFKQLFFRLYDRKITSGAMSFGQTGIKKEDFTRLCTEEDFVFPREELSALCERMEASEAEKAALFEAAAPLWEKAEEEQA